MAVFLLLVGSVLDGLALMLLTTPILLPIVTDLGLSPIWFGIFLVRAMEIGFVHPPIGMNLYVIQGVAPDVPLGRIFRGVLPFLAADLVHLVLLDPVPGDRAGPAAVAGPMSALEQSLDAILRDPLRTALAAGDAIGLVGSDVPLDVLLAADRPFCHLPWQTGRATPWADRWLESGFPGWARSMLEDWHAGRVRRARRRWCSRAPTTRASGSITTCANCSAAAQLRGPAPLIFDLRADPARREPAAHRQLDRRELAAQLGHRPQNICHAASRGRTACAGCSRSCSTDRCSGGRALREDRARRAVRGPDGTGSTAAAAAGPGGGPRVLLAGSVPPDERLHRAGRGGRRSRSSPRRTCAA